MKQIRLSLGGKQFTISSQVIEGRHQHSVWLDEQEIVSSITNEDFWMWAANEIKYIVESRGEVG